MSECEIVLKWCHEWTVEKIAVYFDWSLQTVCDILHRWQKNGLDGLWNSPRPGGKRRWQEADIVYLEDCLRNDPRRYNAKQLAQKLAKERDIELSPQQIRSILRKRGWFGSGLVRVTQISKTLFNEALNITHQIDYDSP